MSRKFSVSSVKKTVLCGAAAALSLGVGPLGMGVSAMAGNTHVSIGYSSGAHYGGSYYAAGYKGHRGHRGHGRRHRGHHGGGGGKAAAIALGVIGGAIILNELAEDRAEDRYARDRYYDDRYGRRTYPDRRYDDRYSGRAYDDAYADDYALAPDYDDAYDDELDGGPSSAASAPASGPVARSAVGASPQAAYQTCLDHARNALGERGFVVTAPYRPETAQDRGGAWVMTATVTAQRGSDRWARAMSCEASAGRVFRMELI